ncbi:hypothetical protein ACWFRF_28975 [Nocardia sp. NPDC055165]
MTVAANAEPPLPFSPVAHQALRGLAVHAGTGVTIVCGFPAAGKTTATRLLAELVDPVVLDKEHLRAAARGVGDGRAERQPVRPRQRPLPPRRLPAPQRRAGQAGRVGRRRHPPGSGRAWLTAAPRDQPKLDDWDT